MRLVDILKANRVTFSLQDYKIHLATHSIHSPLDAFYAGNFKEWQEYQTKRNFQCDMVISLIQYKRNLWLYAGVYKILGVEYIKDHYEYSTELIDENDELIGRLVIYHERTSRQSYLYGEPIEDSFTLASILEKRLSIGEFPGYNSVCIPFDRLKVVIENYEPTWYGALGNVKGVYLITDTLTGKLYVGSAQGNTGIWQRWGDYISTGHAGNVGLKNLLKENGKDYVKNFTFTLLEISDMHSPDELVSIRESYWKDVLCSRNHGYNMN